ncbi:MAG: hypothetical protein VXZ82_00925 [Planctomycetota bacterium]|nr:hypothetical protein [Planctomycetota bacterium]
MTTTITRFCGGIQSLLTITPAHFETSQRLYFRVSLGVKPEPAQHYPRVTEHEWKPVVQSRPINED